MTNIISSDLSSSELRECAVIGRGHGELGRFTTVQFA